MKTKTFPIMRLVSLLRLDPETGLLYWRKGGHGRRLQGSAGYVNPDGYRVITVEGVALLAHRIVFALTHLRWPREQLDHRDGDPGNNRPDNLREATHGQNQHNAHRRSDNTSGFKGVTRQGPGWQATIKANGQRHYVGFSMDPAEAGRLYAEAAAAHHGEFART